MDQHPIPRQITTFEFKLIGFMTLRQFLYLLVFIPLGFVTYYLFPIPLLNLLLGVMVGSLGLIFAFVPIYDRPLDVWIKNLFKRLTKPTRYFFSKRNPPIYYLENLFFVSDPHRTASHIESEEKLTTYLAQVKKKDEEIKKINQKKQTINALFKKTVSQTNTKVVVDQPTKTHTVGKTPFFTGLVKNHKLIPLPGVLIYVKGSDNQTLRLLKTNPHGVFATFSPLPSGEYFFEFKDPNNNFFFDKMKIKVDSVNPSPIEAYSKELL